MISRCEWTFAKSMPFAPHEYIVKDKCPLTTEEFEYFVNMQREHGVKERWGKHNNAYLYIDDYKYWTMDAPLEETKVINRAKINVLKDIRRICDEINKIKVEVEESLPYHFNAVLDAGPLEPGVSSILAGFFKQKVCGRYLILESFVQHFFGNSFLSQIEKPTIKVEVEVKDMKRIDILVYEKNKYAIVFENKIWDAVEQPNQLENYINGMKEPRYGFTDEQIYIVYLSSTAEHGPTNISWSKTTQRKYESRYRNIDFKNDVLGWLETEDIQKLDEQYFTCSRFLFIDFLKRKFNLTETANMENRKIEEYLRDELELKENDKGYNIAVLAGRLKEISECTSHLERMRKNYCEQVINEIAENLGKEYPNRTICNNLKYAQSIYTGIAIPYKNMSDAIYVLIGFEGQNFIYGATYAPAYKALRNEMQESEEIARFYSNGDFRKGSDWLFYKNTTIDEGYKFLKELIGLMIK